MMATKIFVNLPVNDLKKSIAFFTRLGFAFDPQFTDETATCMIVGEDIYVMLLTREKFASFTPNPICDATKSTEVLVCLSRESRDLVDEMVRKAVATGGRVFRQPQDHGFMYEHGFQDPDGHIWELIHMDPAAMKRD
jgi:predicted lactoylglutathione lyase